MPGQIITATADWNVSSTSNFSNAATVVGTASALFVSTDVTTQGTWRNAYGAEGYDIAADSMRRQPQAAILCHPGNHRRLDLHLGGEHHRRPGLAELR